MSDSTLVHYKTRRSTVERDRRKSTMLLWLLVAVAVTVASAGVTPIPDDDSKTDPAGSKPDTTGHKVNSTYTTKYDNINLDHILNNKRLVHHYVLCLLERRTCSPEGATLRRILPEALRTTCARCTPAQKVGASKAISKLQKDFPTEWNLLLNKWDPTREYSKRYQPARTPPD